MKLARLYLDEDASRNDLLAALRRWDVDVISAVEAGNAARSDPWQLEWAAREDRAIFSFNVKDFVRLHAIWTEAGRPHHGIIVCPQRRWGVGEIMRRLRRAAFELGADGLRNRLEYLSNW